MVGIHGSADDTAKSMFEPFFRANYEPLVRYVARRVPASHVDDIVAATFAIAWKKFDDVGHPSLPWLYRVASFEVSNFRRTRRRSKFSAGQVPDTEESDTGAERFDGSRIRNALARLSESDQELLRLIHWDGLSRAEAALVLNITTNALGVRQHRALRRLLEFCESDRANDTTPGSSADDSIPNTEVLP
jgi:RNA polymerase sigma-70 factor (ECF subfamily)